MEAPFYDVVVAGGGAAGLSAVSCWAGRGAGSPWSMPERHATLPRLTCRGSCPVTGCRRATCWPRDGRVSGYGVELVEDQVAGIEAGFFVRLAGGQVLKARRILVATGVATSCRTSLGSASGGAGSPALPVLPRWEVRDQPIGSWAPSPARCSMHSWCGSGPMTWSSSSTPMA